MSSRQCISVCIQWTLVQRAFWLFFVNSALNSNASKISIPEFLQDDEGEALSLLQVQKSKTNVQMAHPTFLQSLESTKVCIFDIDQTLTSGSKASTEPGWPLKAITMCQQKGYQIGIATARIDGLPGGGDRPAAIPEAVLPDSFFSSAAFQKNAMSWSSVGHAMASLGGANKTEEVMKIMAYYKATPQCTVFFDDMEHNRAYIEKSPGTSRVTCQAASEAACENESNGWFGSWFSPISKIHCMHHATGLTETEFNRGITKMEAACSSSS
eukprot:TRINITY_DN110525_c0_g1_i1.p1 TRINITY_DN110525_c0_g1~~TRINITY_DN110525_c0_g1_i1.p1  ORF type:complete len:269 (+),score=38.43 TRINITY_DN110525_c0_g1_i1:74-880(+)